MKNKELIKQALKYLFIPEDSSEPLNMARVPPLGYGLPVPLGLEQLKP